jgi:hypothetical protein
MRPVQQMPETNLDVNSVLRSLCWRQLQQGVRCFQVQSVKLKWVHWMQPKEAVLVRHAPDSVAREQNEPSHQLHVQRIPMAGCYFACASGSLVCQANAAALRQASFVQPADEAVPCDLRLIPHLFQSEAWRAQGNAVANARNATYDGRFVKLAQESSQSLNM